MTSKGAAPDIITPTPASAPPPVSGAGVPRLEKYELLEEIGHGGMATVYRARDPRLGREVAVKVIHKHLRENAEVATRFVAEARAAAKLRHPGIVEVYDVSSEDDPEQYLVVELLRGTTLRKILQQNREMPAEVGAAIALEICEALEHAHEAGIIHRDIKPENVLVELPSDRAAVSGKNSGSPSRPGERSSPAPGGRQHETDPDSGPEGPRSQAQSTPTPSEARSSRKGARQADLGVVIKITDFGIAKVLDAQGVTSTGQVLGSPAHMAPEQIEGGEVDARTDVFAVGVLTYEAMVGHLPFEGKNPAQVLRKVLDGQFVPADRERATVGGRWAKILARALARDAADRTATPGALAEAIRSELAALGIDDPKAEILAYFRDPAGYASELTVRLVPKIVARGEAARRSGDVPGAAADFNRALALAPNDLTILKRLTSLTSSANRRLLARRIGMIAGGTAAALLLAFGVTRLVRSIGQSTSQETVPTTPTTAAAAPSPPPVTAVSAAEVKTAAAKPSASAPDREDLPKPKNTAHVSPTGQPTGQPTGEPTATPAGGTRKVSFNILPKGAVLTSIDGRPESSAFGKQYDLPFGPHEAIASIDNKCCKSPKPHPFAVVAPPADKPDKPQVVTIQLELIPASVTSKNVPQAGQVSCGAFTLQGNQTVKDVKLQRHPQQFTCTLMPPNGEPYKRTYTVHAGQDNPIEWQPPP